MISTSRDSNRIPTIMGTLNADGLTPVSVKVNSSTHSLDVSDGTTGTNHPFVDAQRDANRVSVIWGVSSADGVTPIPIYINSSGRLLIQST